MLLSNYSNMNNVDLTISQHDNKLNADIIVYEN